MSRTIFWGILGPGSIAHKFTRDIRYVKDAKLLAVGSRDLQRARNFAGQYAIPKFFGSYEALVKDPDVDIIYIATPHGRHYEDIKLCLEHGKNVLCEKAFTLNARQAKEVIELARANRLFVMEALWTRFLPVMQKLKKLLSQNIIGELRMITADLGFNFPFDPQSRLFNPLLGGGALLDLGVYPISIIHWLLGKPQSVVSQAVLGESGVDEQSGMVFKFENDIIANIYTSVRSATPSRAIFSGSEGSLILKAPLYCPSGIALKFQNGKSKHYSAPMKGGGFNYEISEANRCLNEGKLQSKIMSWKDTIEVMEIMDVLRNQWGLCYPQEGNEEGKN